MDSDYFSARDAETILAISDCTNVNTESSDVSELIRQQLYSLYYKHTCAKYNITISRIGGVTCCSPGQGGPASDHTCMEKAGLFEEKKWEVGEGKTWASLLYDAGSYAHQY